ncbi:hypothetical protein EDB84DRAFT_1679162 [Lactarius hengduanensis]|nr:hypothetical protein EDB84DRAFT_1679162 [Lactarius hengduanensis]
MSCTTQGRARPLASPITIEPCSSPFALASAVHLHAALAIRHQRVPTPGGHRYEVSRRAEAGHGVTELMLMVMTDTVAPADTFRHQLCNGLVLLILMLPPPKRAQAQVESLISTPDIFNFCLKGFSSAHCLISSGPIVVIFVAVKNEDPWCLCPLASEGITTSITVGPLGARWRRWSSGAAC